jgi:RNA polymerase primary sigma factor
MNKYFYHPSFDNQLTFDNIPETNEILTPTQEFRLFQELNYCKHIGDLNKACLVRNKIANHNIKLVKHLAKILSIKIHTTSCEVIGEVFEHLMIAIDKFDFTRGFKFSTYATAVIQRRFKREHGKSKEVITEELDSVIDNREHECSRNERIKQVKENVNQLLNSLDARKKHIIMATIVGIDGVVYNNVTLGKKMHLSDERVRQIKNKALEILREKAKNRAILEE